MLTFLCLSLCLFLSLGTGAWNDVSMEDLQTCIMNQDDSRFFQDLPLRSVARDIHGEVSFLSAQRDVKLLDKLFFMSLSYFLYLGRHRNWDKKLSLCGHFEEWVPVILRGCLLSSVIEGWKHTNLSLCYTRVNKSSNPTGVHWRLSKEWHWNSFESILLWQWSWNVWIHFKSALHQQF